MRITHWLSAALLSVLSAACVNLEPDYRVPANQPVARVKVTLSPPLRMVNGKIIVHGSNVCDATQARLAAVLTNWDAMGVSKKDAVFTIPAEYPISVSMPILIGTGALKGAGVEGTSTYSQPVVTFTPQAGKSYELEFKQTTGSVFMLASDPASTRTGVQRSSVNTSCKVTATNQGTEKMQFYLAAP